MTHTCKVCGATKSTEEFYRGVKSRCKDCHRNAVKENREKKAEYYKEYDAKRFKEDPRVRERHRLYQSTDAGKASMKRARDKWIAQDPRRRAAHIILNNAVKNKKILKPDTCSECGSTGIIEGHHPDYDYPLSVQWLCTMCHDAKHKENR